MPHPPNSHLRKPIYENLPDMTIAQFFRKIFSRLLFGNCLGIILTSTLLLVGGMLFIRYYTQHGVEVEMPDVCGKARKWLPENSKPWASKWK